MFFVSCPDDGRSFRDSDINRGELRPRSGQCKVFRWLELGFGLNSSVVPAKTQSLRYHSGGNVQIDAPIVHYHRSPQFVRFTEHFSDLESDLRLGYVHLNRPSSKAIVHSKTARARWRLVHTQIYLSVSPVSLASLFQTFCPFLFQDLVVLSTCSDHSFCLGFHVFPLFLYLLSF